MNTVSSVDDSALNGFFERIMRLEEEKQATVDDIKDVYTEAKSNGIDVKILRKTVSRAKKDKAEVEQEDTLVDLYETALARKAK